MPRVELSREPKYLPYNYGSHFISVPELRREIRKWRKNLGLQDLNRKSKEFLIDFALENDILKNYFMDKNMPFPPPADSHEKKKPSEAKKDEERAAKAAARMAAKAAKKAEGPKKRGRKPKAKAAEPEKKEEPVVVATPAPVAEPVKTKRKLKLKTVASAAAPAAAEDKNVLFTSAVDDQNRRIPLSRYLEGNKGKGLSVKMLKFQYLQELEKRKALAPPAAAEPPAEKKKRTPNAFALFVKANKKPGMSMKDVAELYKNSKEAAKEAAKEEPKKEEPKKEEPKKEEPKKEEAVKPTRKLKLRFEVPKEEQKPTTPVSQTKPRVPEGARRLNQMRNLKLDTASASSSDEDKAARPSNEKELLDYANLSAVRESFSSLDDYMKKTGRSLDFLKKNFDSFKKAREEEAKKAEKERASMTQEEKDFEKKSKIFSDLRSKIPGMKLVELNKLFSELAFNPKNIDKFISKAKELMKD